MWVAEKFFDQLHISRESVDKLRQELAAVKAERDNLKLQAVADRTNFDWLRTRINALELENKALIQKAYDIRLPAPELIRTSNQAAADANTPMDIFGDIGEDLAKHLGLPQYEK